EKTEAVWHARNPSWRCPTTSARRSPAGPTGPRVPSASPFAPGSSWPVPRGPPTRSWPSNWAFAVPPSAPGPAGSWPAGWRGRPGAGRLEGLADEPRPGAPRTVTDEAVEKVVTRTLETKPSHATHWSTRGMAQASGLSQSTVGRIWRAFGLKPHRADTFKLSA